MDDNEEGINVPLAIKSKFAEFLAGAAKEEIYLVECTDTETNEPVWVMCRVVEVEDRFDVYPLQVLDENDPTDSVTPPAPMNRSIDDLH